MKKMAFLSLKNITITAAILAGLYQIISTQYLVEGGLEFRNTHLAFTLVLVFLGMGEGKKKSRLLVILLTAAAIATTMYIKVFAEELEWRAGSPTLLDQVVGWLLIALVLEGCRQEYGPALSTISLLGILYMFFGKYTTDVLRVADLDPDTIVSFLVTGHTGTGLYGGLLDVSAKYIFIFILFGGLIEGVGAGRFFEELSKVISKWVSGGTPLGAVISSGFVGMVTGAPAANVGITGVYTIPAMKAAGLKPEVSAAFEACAAVGSAVMPPVMGGDCFPNGWHARDTLCGRMFIVGISSCPFLFHFRPSGPVCGYETEVEASQGKGRS